MLHYFYRTACFPFIDLVSKKDFSKSSIIQKIRGNKKYSGTSNKNFLKFPLNDDDNENALCKLLVLLIALIILFFAVIFHLTVTVK